MSEQQEEQNTFAYHPDEYGEIMVDWEVDEYPQHERSKWWYLIMGVIGVGLIVYSIATANFLFAVIILMGGIIMLLAQFVKPSRIPVVITTTGVIVGDTYYDFQAVRDFSIAYDPPDVKILYLDFYALSHPLISIPLEDVDPNTVRESLLPFCMENLHRTEEGLNDVMRRLYKL